MPTLLLTGAASGIGRAAAMAFARTGWSCVLADRDLPGLERLLADLPAPPGAMHAPRVLDLADPGQVARLGDGLPALDAVVNNAGISDDSGTGLAEQPPDRMDRLLALNLEAPAAVVDACMPRLRPGARIVNLASGAGLRAIPWRGAYSPSKAGLIAQTRALARARPDLRVTALCPGFVRTELVEGLIRAGRLRPEAAVGRIPLGRMAEPDELAAAIHFLAGPGAAPLHGSVLAVDGGSSVQGSSRPFAPAAHDTLPFDVPLLLEIIGSDPAPWRDAAPSAGSAGSTDLYDAVLDVTPLDSPPGGLLRAAHAAAARFAARHPDRASLTLLLPAREEPDWRRAGDAAAARMLVATLACEWGARALRINALALPPGTDPRTLHPLLRYVAGAGAQYLTGQTLDCAGAATQPADPASPS